MAKHLSVPISSSVELIDIAPTEYSPLISKCVIKVCYVGEEPNRNGSVITKETAKKMAPSLRGSVIVGYYNEHEEDFEEHNKIIEISNGKFDIRDTTRPYGFVDVNAPVWFQKYMDDARVEREYLCTQGFLWTGIYPESQRVITEGNNQSMELSQEFLNGTWAAKDNMSPEFFIINEAVIEKLCILGEDVEPCFEGANIGVENIMFSFNDNFKEKLYTMMNELKEILEEGGKTSMNQNEQEMIDFKEKEKEEETEEKEEKEEEVEDPKDEEQQPEEEPEDEEKKKKYILESEEYVELKTQYDSLVADYAALKAEKEALESTNNSLTEFKHNIEKQQKQEMINSFYMLSDEDKADVLTNIDNYSLEDIEAKLSVICVRKKVNFNLDDETSKEEPVTTFSITEQTRENSDIPEWIQAINAVIDERNN